MWNSVFQQVSRGLRCAEAVTGCIPDQIHLEVDTVMKDTKL